MNCIKCGNPLTEGEKFCPSCGNPVENAGESVEQTEVVQNTEIPRISKRNVAGAIVFTILTCGLFMYFWFFWVINDTKKLTDDKNLTTTPFKVLLIMIIAVFVSIIISPVIMIWVSIITVLYAMGLVIYIYYISYRIGWLLAIAGSKYGKQVQNNSVLYLILSIIGLPLITLCIIQSDLNLFGVEKGQ